MYPDGGVSHLAALFEFPGRHAIDAGSQQDLAMLVVANIAPVLAGAALQCTLSPDRQTAAIRAVIGACRRVLCWLALRGDPPGNRCLPDIVPSRGAAAAKAASRRGSNRKPRPHDQRFLPQVWKTGRPRSLSRRQFRPVQTGRAAAALRAGERLCLSHSPE